MKEVVIEKFDGVTMSAIVGERVELNEQTAVKIVADLKEREAEHVEKGARLEALNEEISKLENEFLDETPALEADIAQAKVLIENLVSCYEENAQAIPDALAEFIDYVPSAESEADETETADDAPSETATT